ncbi:hypothetical protein TWF481_004979 [Arthrobotrys musiformis]|uniref:Oxidoreductase acuF-like C2H2 type zinc-finger domain-containing protein n=1 Tax=Arthrobotrys musiformis TaxID=47236 RepID=A0AAV9WMQ9_9PEZI
MDELFRAHQSCCQKFAKLVMLTESPTRDFSSQVSRRDWDIEVERYKIWANGVGVGESGDNYEKSLDCRLRNASFMRSQVALVLKLLIEHIDNAITLLNGERVPWEDLAIGSTQKSKDASKDTTKPTKDGSDDETGDDSPWDFSSDEGSIDENSSDSYMAGNEISRKPTIGTIAKLQSPEMRGRTDFPAGEMAQIRHAVQTAISSLYGLPIRKAVIQDRLRGELPAEIASFEESDISYVKFKFPQLVRYSPEAAARLGKLITRRREILHSRRVQDSHKQWSNESTAPKITRGQNEGANDGLRNPSWLEPPSYTEFAHPQPASTIATESLEVVMPRRPLGENEEEPNVFVCPYCCTKKEIKSDAEWKAHVLQDLQPYVCTFPNCEFRDLFFETKEQWFQHEQAKHRINWFCNTKSHSRFKTKAEFRSHMTKKHSHDVKFDDLEPEMISKLFAIPANPTDPGICTLCMEEVQNPEAHVSQHLEMLALFAIPRQDFPEGRYKERPGIDGRGKIKITESKQLRSIDNQFSGPASPLTKVDPRPLAGSEGHGSINLEAPVEAKHRVPSKPAPPYAYETGGPATSRGFGKPSRRRHIKLRDKTKAFESSSSSEFLFDSSLSTDTGSDSDLDGMAFGTPPRRLNFESDTYTTPPSSFSELHSKFKSWAKPINIFGPPPKSTSKRSSYHRGWLRANSHQGPSFKVPKRKGSFDFNIAFGYSSSDSSAKGHRPASLSDLVTAGSVSDQTQGQSKPKRGGILGSVRRSASVSFSGYTSPGFGRQRLRKKESLDSNLAFGESSSEDLPADDVSKPHDSTAKKHVWRRWWRTGEGDIKADTSSSSGPPGPNLYTAI